MALATTLTALHIPRVFIFVFCRQTDRQQERETKTQLVCFILSPFPIDKQYTPIWNTIKTIMNGICRLSKCKNRFVIEYCDWYRNILCYYFLFLVLLLCFSLYVSELEIGFSWALTTMCVGLWKCSADFIQLFRGKRQQERWY